MFSTFFFTELRTALKQPMIYIFFGLMALLVFLAVVSDNVVIGGTVGNVYKNAPHVITTYTIILSLFGLLIATAFFNNAALRDHNYQFQEILFSTPLSKAGYFFGRFFGAMLLATLPMLGVFFGIWLGSKLGPAFNWIDSDRIGPMYLETFVNNYFLFVLPNMFFAGSIIFPLASKWKSTVVSFVGALLIIVGYIVSGTLLSDIENERTGALLDIFGIRAYNVVAKYFTPAEKNTLNPTFTDLLLYNRLIWMGAGILILIIGYATFSFREKLRGRKSKQTEEPEAEIFAPSAIPVVQGRFNLGTEWAQFRSFFKVDFLSIIRSNTFKILFVFSVIILVTNFFGSFEYFGLQSYPVTYKMVDIIDGTSSLFVIIILVFFSGELVFMSRDRKINEVIDASPHTSVVSLLAKAISLVSITIILHIFFTLCSVVFQLAKGYTLLELDVYLIDFLISNLPVYITWSCLLIFIQILINNKYVGYFVSVLILFLLDILYSVLDFTSNMISPGARPSVLYSDMNGFGAGVRGALWFDAYWLLAAAIILLVAGLLWKRGIAENFKARLKSGFRQLQGKYAVTFASISVLWLLVGGFVYYNTKILNDYYTPDEREEMQAQYEKKYKQYQSMTLPKITDVKYAIDIFPENRDVKVKAVLQIINNSKKAIDSIAFTIDEDWNPEIKIPNAEIILDDKDLDFRIYKLKSPLQPGEKRRIEIETAYISKGFENETVNRSVARNGTFLNNSQILPQFGYSEGLEMQEKNKRKEYGLAPKERMPALEENCGEACMKNYLSEGLADWVNVETIISTAEGQIAVAPGSLVREWQQNGRKYYHYRLDHPSQNFYSFISADYEVARKKWKGIDIEVYYDKKHNYNIDMMLDAVQRSLEYYTQHFGPYLHKQARIVEFPRYASFAQAFPGTMPYSESLGFITNLEDETANNVVDAVIAHEMAHQWWAHQVIGAEMQGATMLSESFAEYSSLMVMKAISDEMKMREFIKYDFERYLGGRSSEIEKELPLYKVENQGHIHYGKGSVVMFAMQDYIGEDKVNEALRGFLQEYRYKPPPYSTSLDFLRYLEPQVPDSLKHLINDWFREITLYDLRLKEAKYEKLPGAQYKVTLQVEAHKLLADTLGNEQELPINDWVEIGAFATDDEEKLLHKERVHITKPEMTFTFTLDTIPAKAAIDPRRILIERVYSDNVKGVGER